MKKTIAQLEREIERLEKDKGYWYDKYTEINEEVKKKRENEMFNLSNHNNELKSQVQNLIEIIRWHINPETTKSPFSPTKDQRDSDTRFRD